jgi:hypothetical protein
MYALWIVPRFSKAEGFQQATAKDRVCIREISGEGGNKEFMSVLSPFCSDQLSKLHTLQAAKAR